MYNSVLVPTDGSDDSLIAVEHAIDVADQYDATLHTQYVIETTQATEVLDESEQAELLGPLEEAGEQAVEEVVEKASAAGVTCDAAVVEQGTPADRILDYVTRNDIEMVVMATRGRTGESRELMGSVTETVVRSSPVPVLTVNVGESA